MTWLAYSIYQVGCVNWAAWLFIQDMCFAIFFFLPKMDKLVSYEYVHIEVSDQYLNSIMHLDWSWHTWHICRPGYLDHILPFHHNWMWVRPPCMPPSHCHTVFSVTALMRIWAHLSSCTLWKHSEVSLPPACTQTTGLLHGSMLATMQHSVV